MKDYLKSWMILVFGIVIIFGSGWASVAAQEYTGEENGIENENEGGSSPEGSNEEKQGYTEMFGKFDITEGSLSGKYVSFDQNKGMMNNYSYVPQGERIFKAVDFSFGIIAEENTRMEGAVYHAEANGLHVTSHNNPSAILHWVCTSVARLDAR